MEARTSTNSGGNGHGDGFTSENQTKTHIEASQTPMLEQTPSIEAPTTGEEKIGAEVEEHSEDIETQVAATNEDRLVPITDEGALVTNTTEAAGSSQGGSGHNRIELMAGGETNRLAPSDDRLAPNHVRKVINLAGVEVEIPVVKDVPIAEDVPVAIASADNQGEQSMATKKRLREEVDDQIIILDDTDESEVQELYIGSPPSEDADWDWDLWDSAHGY